MATAAKRQATDEVPESVKQGVVTQAELDRLGDMFEGEERRNHFNVVSMNKIEGEQLPESFDDAMKALDDAGITVGTVDEEMVAEWPEIDKDKLINRECLFLNWTISRPESESYGKPFVVVRGITRDGIRFRFTDGSTGVKDQLIKLTNRRVQDGNKTPNAGLHCRTGLTVSRNYATGQYDDKGVEIRGTTYYIANE